MSFTFEPHDFSLVKKAPLALNSLHCSRPGPRIELLQARAQKFKVPGSQHVLSKCEGSRSLAGSGQALN